MKTVAICSHEIVKALENELTDAAQSGTLTAEWLAKAICSTDEAGYDSIPTSIGAAWLTSWTDPDVHDAETLARNLSQLPDMVATYWMAITNHNIMAVVRVRRLLEFLPAMDNAFDSPQSMFVSEVIRHHDIDNRIMQALLNNGVDSRLIVRAVLDKLRETVIDPNASTTANFMRHSFLEGGADGLHHIKAVNDWSAEWRISPMPDGRTLWSIMPEEQLYEALLICAEKVPSAFFGWRTQFDKAAVIETMETYLGCNRAAELLLIAAGNLPNPCGSVNVWQRFSSMQLVDLIDRYQGGNWPSLIVHITLRLTKTGLTSMARPFLKKHIAAASLNARFLAEEYINLQPTLDKFSPHAAELGEYIDQVFRTNLNWMGFKIGAMQKDTYNGRPQYVVMIDDKRYISESSYRQDGQYHFLNEGDIVIFWVSRESRTRRNLRVDFRLVRRAGNN